MEELLYKAGLSTICGLGRGVGGMWPLSLSPISHFYAFSGKNFAEQKCMPGGCIPPASVAISTRGRGRCLPLGRGGCLPRPWTHNPSITTPPFTTTPFYHPPPLWTEWVADTFQNITFPQTSIAGGNNRLAPPSPHPTRVWDILDPPLDYHWTITFLLTKIKWYVYWSTIKEKFGISCNEEKRASLQGRFSILYFCSYLYSVFNKQFVHGKRAVTMPSWSFQAVEPLLCGQ